jgi:hypothetical protein
MIRENYMSNFVKVLAFQPSILNMAWPNYSRKPIL